MLEKEVIRTEREGLPLGWVLLWIGLALAWATMR